MDEQDILGGTKRQGWIVLLIAILIAFIGGGVATAYAVRHWDRVAALVRPSQPAPPSVRIVTRPVIVPKGQADPQLARKVQALDDRVEAIDTQAREASGNADRAEGLLVAFAARRVIDRGQPLGYLESMLRDHFGGVDPQAVAMVIAGAQRPVTLTMLQQGFAELSPRLVAPPPRQSWWSGFRREMGTLFVVRRVETPSTRPSDRRDRASRALDLGQVEVALTEITRLPGATGAREWVASARRYVLVHNALDRIETDALLAPPPAVAATTPAPVSAPTQL